MKHNRIALKRVLAGSLTAAMLLTTAAAAGFNDTNSHWAKAYIEDLAAKGKIAGYDDGSFKPDAKVTNLETLIFVSRIAMDDNTPVDQIVAKWNETVKTIMKGASDWSYKNLAVCLEAGIISEADLKKLSDGAALNKQATREDLAVYLVRAMQLAPVAATLESYPLTFADTSSVSTAAKPSVYLLTQNKIVEGMENNKFEPQGQVTRAQVAAMLSRALEYMDKNGITPEFSEFSSFAYEAGTVAGCTVDGGNVLLSLRNVKDEKLDLKVPNTAKFYNDGVKVEPSAIPVGGFARVNYKSANDKTVEAVKVLSSPKATSGSVLTVDQDKVSIKDSTGATSTLKLDRFTQVLAGGKVGDRSVVDAKAGYKTAACVTDGTGRLLSLKLMGGGYEETGIIADVDVDEGELLVNNTSGIITRYTIPSTADVTINGIAGSLASKYVGRYVSVRVSYDDGKVTDVDVDNNTEYLQAIFESVSTYEATTTMKVTGISDGKSASYKMTSGCKITYEGKEVNAINLGKGSMVTLKIENNKITDVQAASGNYEAVGSLDNIQFGTTIILEFKDDDGNIVIFNLNPNRLPTIKRDDKTSSIDKLTSADTITVTVKSGKVSLIEAKTKSTTVSGKVDRISFDASGNLLYLTDKDGETQPYTLSTGVSVTNGSTKIEISDVVGGNVTLTIVNGLVTEVKLTGGTAATGELTGTVLFVNTSDKVILLATEGARVDGRVSVSVPSTAKIMNLSGSSVSLSNIDLGDQLQVFGAYKGDEFVATMVLVK